MKNALNYAMLGLILALTGSVVAQTKVSATIRPRTEYLHGFSTLPDSAAQNGLFTTQRTRITLDHKKDNIEVRVSVQDVRTWGNQSQLVGNENFGVSIHEAWGKAWLNDKWAVKFGRQEISYDDQRILGSVDWAQQARSHDVILFQYKHEKLKLDIGGAYNQNGPQLNTTSYNVARSYKTLQYLWANYAFNKEFNTSILAMSVGQQVNYTNTAGISRHHDNYTLTAGTRMEYEKEKFKLAFNGYYQLGSTNTRPAMNVSAYNLNLDFKYKLSDHLKLGIGAELLSGNSQTDTSSAYTSVQHAFNPYFGTNHKFNGVMDYFYVDNHIGNVGLNDGYLSLFYKNKKFNAGLTGHVFLANANILDEQEFINNGNITALSPYLGTEIDIFGSFNITNGAKCKLGYSQLFATESMEAIKGGDRNEIANWAYVMIIFKPTIFERK